MPVTPGRQASTLMVPESIADQIASILEQEILRGRFERGEHLQQDDLCGRFGVSRTPVREALRKLQALGLLELIPNKGAMVRKPTFEELRQSYAVRAELEGFAASLATLNRDDALVATLAQAQEQLSQAVRSAMVTDADDAAVNEPLKVFNDQFHQAIHAASDNATLQELVRKLERQFPKDTVRRAISEPEDLQLFYVTEHDEILEEIVAGRPESARDAMRGHIYRSQTMLLNYLKDIGFDS